MHVRRATTPFTLEHHRRIYDRHPLIHAVIIFTRKKNIAPFHLFSRFVALFLSKTIKRYLNASSFFPGERIHFLCENYDCLLIKNKQFQWRKSNFRWKTYKTYFFAGMQQTILLVKTEFNDSRACMTGLKLGF